MRAVIFLFDVPHLFLVFIIKTMLFKKYQLITMDKSQRKFKLVRLNKIKFSLAKSHRANLCSKKVDMTERDKRLGWEGGGTEIMKIGLDK